MAEKPTTTTKPTNKPNPVKKPISVQKEETIPSPPKPASWLKDNSKKVVWSMVSIPNCDWSQKALQLLREHGEEHIHHQTHSESTAQEAISKGLNYSPCIYMNGKLLGSYKELESYYSRNYFSMIREAV
tara:strand:+ start:2761 stop:3147 length:387 start_codon:yes stop_codon:yes gene_type:complete